MTPTLSTLRTLADLAETTDVVVVHHARTPADLIERPELEALAAAHDGVRIVWVVDQPDASWSGPTGLMSAGQLAELVPDAGGREVFCCGPSGYMGAARTAFEAWVASPRGGTRRASSSLTPRRSRRRPLPAGEAYRIRLQRSGRDLVVPRTRLSWTP